MLEVVQVFDNQLIDSLTDLTAAEVSAEKNVDLLTLRFSSEIALTIQDRDLCGWAGSFSYF